MILRLFQLMNDEPGAGGGAAGGEGGSALAGGGEQPPALHERIPEKHRVFEGEGDEAKFNLEASAGKLVDAYESLEKRLGSGDVPPESVEGYQLDGKAIGEDFDAEAFMSDETNKGFLAKAHAHGMTNKQVQMVVEHALKEFAPGLMQGNAALDSDGCIQALKSDVWKDDAEFKQNMGAANRLFRSLPEDLRDQVSDRLGNDPLFIQVAAIFGKEMGEDTPPQGAGSGSDQAAIEELMTSEAYKNPNHPQHAAVSERVRKYFESQTHQQVA